MMMRGNPHLTRSPSEGGSGRKGLLQLVMVVKVWWPGFCSSDHHILADQETEFARSGAGLQPKEPGLTLQATPPSPKEPQLL